MKTILWVSRHQPLPSQVKELQRLFGEDCKIVIENRKFDGAMTIYREFERQKADEIVLVAPMTVCKAILELGVKPLYAQMVKSNPSYSETQAKDYCYKFVQFKRLVGIDFKLEEI